MGWRALHAMIWAWDHGTAARFARWVGSWATAAEMHNAAHAAHAGRRLRVHVTTLGNEADNAVPVLHPERRVRWHVATLGTEVDLHNAHWHGNTFLQRGLRDDQTKLIPGSVESVVMDADNPGTWWLHCHVSGGSWPLTAQAP
jgi:hypothetical protein